MPPSRGLCAVDRIRGHVTMNTRKYWISCRAEARQSVLLVLTSTSYPFIDFIRFCPCVPWPAGTDGGHRAHRAFLSCHHDACCRLYSRALHDEHTQISDKLQSRSTLVSSLSSRIDLNKPIHWSASSVSAHVCCGRPKRTADIAPIVRFPCHHDVCCRLYPRIHHDEHTQISGKLRSRSTPVNSLGCRIDLIPIHRLHPFLPMWSMQLRTLPSHRWFGQMRFGQHSPRLLYRLYYTAQPMWGQVLVITQVGRKW